MKYFSIALDLISIFLNIAIIICLVSSFKKKNEKMENGDNIPKFVEDSFSLDYADKAWWLE